MAQNQNAIHANVFCVLFASLKATEETLIVKSRAYVGVWWDPTACLGEDVSRETWDSL
jgi:hypothetical protein